MSALDTWNVLRCAIHVHTAFSDGALSMSEVVDEAQSAGVDVLMITDHDAAGAVREGWEGRQGSLLVIIGAECRTKDEDHLLLFGTHEKIATRLFDTPTALALVNKLDVPAFVAHPQGRPQQFFFKRRYVWRHWDLKGYAGVEVWSYMHDWIEHCSPLRLPAMCREPDRHVTGPDPAVISRWDALAERRHIAGIGGLDTHGVFLPFGLGRLLGWARDGILPYEQNFQAFATYALLEARPRDAREGARDVLSALQHGRSWICHDALHSGREARYWAEVDGRQLPPGTETVFTPGLMLRVELPTRGSIRLMCRGECVAEVEGESLQYEPASPGAYRVEVRLQDALWLLTNHIYLRAPAVA